MAQLLESFFLKYSRTLSVLRRVPGLGAITHRVSHSVLPPDRLAWFQVNKGAAKGLWLRLHPRTGVDCYHGEAEAGLQKVFQSHIRPGMVCYDLGANIGFFTLLAARLSGPSGKVFAFEADPEVAKRLREHVERNELRNVRVINQALWSSTGSVTFERADEGLSPDRALGRVLPAPSQANRAIQIRCVALEDFALREDPPDFIKCDVEGAEAEVLIAAREMLARRRPLVACEIHSDQNAARLKPFFADLGYSLEWFTDMHFLAVPQPAAVVPMARSSRADSV